LHYIPPSVTNSETSTHTTQSQTHTNKPHYILKTNVTITYDNRPQTSGLHMCLTTFGLAKNVRYVACCGRTTLMTYHWQCRL